MCLLVTKKTDEVIVQENKTLRLLFCNKLVLQCHKKCFFEIVDGSTPKLSKVVLSLCTENAD